MAAGAAAVAGWCLFATASYIFGKSSGTFETADTREIAKYTRWVQELRAKDALSRSLLEERTDAYQRTIVEFEERQETLNVMLDALRGGEKLEVSSLRGNGAGLLVRASIDEATPRQSRLAPVTTASIANVGLRAQIDDLHEEQEIFLNAAEDTAIERAERARGILRLTAIGTGEIEAGQEMGGPLIEMAALNSDPTTLTTEARFASRVARVAARMEEARYYEEVVSALPLGQPSSETLRFTSPYGFRTDPFNRTSSWHGGIDMAAFNKAPITAAGPGKVIFAGRKSGYGRTVDVDHGYGFISRYAHMARINVSKGDEVAIGDTLGLMGNSGRSTGPHLHFEVWFNGKAYDPTNFLKAGRHVHEG